MIVVDINIIAYFYLTSPKSELAEKLLLIDCDWQVPRLWRSEFRSVVSLYLRKKILPYEDILVILHEAEDLLKNNEYDLPSADIMPLVSSSRCSAYDCEFVALAKCLSVPLVTEDKKILKAFPETAISLQDFLSLHSGKKI
ncbi:MAG: type II toxin-antitoxin system VapC family toxin [Enterobacterales bacterium]|nr:type II toxin-antitoxin system VapC family toxin [Enterobacterales bacterium]